MAVIKRIDFQSQASTTERCFRALVVPDGYADPAERIAAANEVWTNLVRFVDPFKLCGNPGHPASRMFAVYCWTEDLPSLNVQQTGGRLSIPLTSANAIKDGLTDVPIRDATPTVSRPAHEIWPPGGHAGRYGSLVVVLKKGTAAGELYEIANSPNYPLPTVGFVHTGILYVNLLARAVAQQFAGLADEFELPGPEFLKAQADDSTLQAPNVLLVNDARRARLAAGDVSDLKRLVRWPLTGAPLGFFAHTGNEPDVEKKKRRGGMALIEGAGGYRFNAFRADTDCILRRTPYSVTLPLLDRTQFCHVCTKWLEKTLGGSETCNALSPGTVEIDRQALHFDRITWKKPGPVQVSTPGSPRPLSARGVGVADRKPAWRFDADADATIGLRITNLKLAGRDVHFDPFFRAEDVAARITFENLKVEYTLDGTKQIKSLSYADAFKEEAGVHLQVNLEGSDLIQAGVKVSFSWTIPGVVIVEAEASLVVRGPQSDIDPGGVILACKWMPQLAMRYRRLPRSGKKLTIDSLEGTIVADFNNRIPTDLQLPADAPEHIKHFRTGRLVAGFFTDSNISHRDSKYSSLIQLGTLNWISGRKLAGVATISGTGARLAHLHAHTPVLPHWSWLFDFATPTVGSSKTTAGTYHRPFGTRNDVSRDGAFNGGLPRRKVFKWPRDEDQTSMQTRDYQMTVEKFARQGGFDNVHAAADHGALAGHPTDRNATITSAPFCGDMCNHLHWRWGATGVAVASDKHAFLGWGERGKNGQGANRVLGAPLIPPNQHLAVTLVPAPTADHVELRYAVRAVVPGEKQWQVFMEQGVGFAFSYEGKLTWGDFFLLARVFGLPRPSGEGQTRDYARREFFDGIYQRIKFFDPVDDETRIFPGVMQTPVRIGADGLYEAPPELEDF